MNGPGGGQGGTGEDHETESESARRIDQTALFIGIVVAVATLAIGGGLLYFLLSENDSEGGRADAAASKSTTTTVAKGSTTTVPGSAAGPGGSSAPGGGAAPGGSTTTTAPPTPMATADPTDPPYVPQPIPAGAGVTLDPGSCRWSPANGGQLEASGTISGVDDFFSVTVYWLQNDRELDEMDTDFIDFDEAGGTQPWHLTTSAPLPPADLRCAVEVF